MKNSQLKKWLSLLIVILVVSAAVYYTVIHTDDISFKRNNQTAGADIFHLVIPDGGVADFTVLAADVITNNAPTTINGSLGISPNSSITGFFGTFINDGPGTVTGTIHQGTLVAANAQSDLNTLFQHIALATPITEDLGSTYLDGRVLTPGIYYTSSTLRLSNNQTLILDAEGDPDATFILRGEKTITIQDGAQVILQNGASACNIFWLGKQGISLGNGTSLFGNMVSNGNIFVNGGTILYGKLLARNSNAGGGITFDGTENIVINRPYCVTTPPPPTTGNVTVIKNVVGGSKAPSDFWMILTRTNGGVSVPMWSSGDANGTLTTLESGTEYTVTEIPSGDYVSSFNGDCSGTILVGDNKTCTVTNTYVDEFETTIKVTKHVVGGTATADQFIMSITNPNRVNNADGIGQNTLVENFLPIPPFPGSELGEVVPIKLSTGINSSEYQVTESGPTGYEASFSSGCTGTITRGDHSECVVTNTYTPPPVSGTVLKLRNVVINGYGGTAAPGDWFLTASGSDRFSDYLSGDSPVDSPEGFASGSYELRADDGPTNYDASEWSCTGATMTDGHTVTVSDGADITCTIYHTQRGEAPTVNRAQVKVTKHVIGGPFTASDFTINVSNQNDGGFQAPAPFPGSESGVVADILMNVGMSVAQFQVTESGPSGYDQSVSGICSGDVKANDFLECVFTNTYRETTGGGGGSRKRLGITLDKVPDVNELPYGGGLVTYNYFVTNTGTVALEEVTLTDDKCTEIEFVSGDEDGDRKLDIREGWKYRCAMVLRETTENIAVVEAQSGGASTSDRATATVVVVERSTFPTPKFPKTGLGPKEIRIPWVILGVAAVVICGGVFFVRKKKNRKQNSQ